MSDVVVEVSSDENNENDNENHHQQVESHNGQNHHIHNRSGEERQRDIVKYRKGIRLISVIDFAVAFIMLFLLSFGFFRVRPDATGDKSVQAFILGMYGLYSVQILVSIILYKGTHKERPEVIMRSFKQWSTTSNFLNVMLCAEVYFFVLIVDSSDGRTILSMTICFLKVIFRGVAVQIVNYSIREMAKLQNLTGVSLPSTLLLSSSDSDSITFTSGSGTGTVTGSSSSRIIDYKPPPAYEFPPKYEEAIKMTHNNNTSNSNCAKNDNDNDNHCHNNNNNNNLTSQA